MKVKVAVIKNPINGSIFVQCMDGNGIGWGGTEEEAKAHALSQVAEWNKNIEDDEIVLEFVTPTELMKEKRIMEEEYIGMVTSIVYKEEIEGMKAKEFFELLYSGELDELILPHLNYLEFMDDVKELLVTYFEVEEKV